MGRIDVRDLSFSYDGGADMVYDHASFSLDTDWKLGFIGRNGKGKTTLLKILMGQLDYTGTVSSPEEFSYFPYEVKDASLTVAAIGEQKTPAWESWKLERELSLLGVRDGLLERPFSSLSQGERVKVLLAILFLSEDRFLLIDEPTSHLDARGRKAVSDYMALKKGYIVVSHDRAFLDGCVDHIMALNRCGIQIVQGNYSSWKADRDARNAAEIRENERLKGEIRRLEDSTRKNAVWSDRVERSKAGAGDKGYVGHMAAKAMKRAKNIERRKEKAVRQRRGLLKEVEEIEPITLFPLEYHAERMAVLQDVAVCYGGRRLFDPVRLEIRRGDRIRLTGPNGAGKSSLLKLLDGQKIPYEGTLAIGSGIIVSYLPQSAEGLRGTVDSFIERSRLDPERFRSALDKLDFPKREMFGRLEELSEGQKKKVLLAKSLCENAHLYLWDEPMNYMDIPSRIQIEQMILEKKPTMVFVEHDERFSERILTKKLELTERRNG